MKIILSDLEPLEYGGGVNLTKLRKNAVTVPCLFYVGRISTQNTFSNLSYFHTCATIWFTFHNDYLFRNVSLDGLALFASREMVLREFQFVNMPLAKDA